VDDWKDTVGLLFLEAAPVILQISIGMIIALAILYIVIYFLKRRRTGTRIGRMGANKCSICGHKVKFLSDCCKAKVKTLGRLAQCPKCGKNCEVVCMGCGHKNCEPTCEKCVRYV
jgi:hypothetical protein